MCIWISANFPFLPQPKSANGQSIMAFGSVGVADFFIRLDTGRTDWGRACTRAWSGAEMIINILSLTDHILIDWSLITNQSTQSNQPAWTFASPCGSTIVTGGVPLPLSLRCDETEMFYFYYTIYVFAHKSHYQTSMRRGIQFSVYKMFT